MVVGLFAWSKGMAELNPQPVAAGKRETMLRTMYAFIFP